VLELLVSRSDTSVLCVRVRVATSQFQTLAYPNVKDPITFLYIWLINFVGDAANLIFLTSAYAPFLLPPPHLPLHPNSLHVPLLDALQLVQVPRVDQSRTAHSHSWSLLR
jgi:hypothetical protein